MTSIRRPLIPTLFVITLIVGACYWFLRPHHTEKVTLAVVGNHILTDRDLNPSVKQQMQIRDFQKFATLSNAVDQWTHATLLELEAKSRSTTVPALFKAEVLDKIITTPEAVQLRYAASPAAGMIGYKEALEKIRVELRKEAQSQNQKVLFDSLKAKYGVATHLNPPAGYMNLQPPPATAFPIYVVHPAQPDVVGGRVVGPPSRGNPSAPVLIEVYSDFMCPFSAKFNQTLKEVLPAYGDKVRVEFRHMPLPFHKGADQISAAAVCAQEQGKFWEYHDGLFAEPGGPDPDRLQRIANKSGVDRARFDACVSKKTYLPFVNSETKRAEERKARATPTFFINGRQLQGAVSPEKLKTLIDWVFKPVGAYPEPPPRAKGDGGKKAAAKPVFQSFSPEELKGAPSKGPADAPVTLIEFVDFQCPHCKNGADYVAKAIAKLPKDVRLVSKQFALPMHQAAVGISEAALCADEQGKYWEFRDEVFGSFWQKTSPEDMKQIAKKLRLNENRFGACLREGRKSDIVKKDIEMGKAKGVQGTPTYFLNGEMLVGSRDPDQLVKLFEAKKAEAQKKK